MRVVHCITGLSGDGAQRMLHRLTDQLQERGVLNYVISLSRQEPLADLFEGRGIPVYPLAMESWRGSLIAPHRMLRLLNDIRPHVLQGWMYHANAALCLARPFLKKRTPLAWNIRRGMDDYRERKLSTRFFVQSNRLLSLSPDTIVYCTRESREQHEQFGFASRRGMVLGNGFNTDVFAPHEEKRRLGRERYGVLDDDILIGNIGRDDTAKGRSFLFEAFSSLIERFPRARLLLVGRGMSDTNHELRRALATRRIAARVILAGECASISEVYPALDILCSSSVAEGFPNVVAEGMSAGLPCVATDTGSSKELVEGVGVVVPSRSASQLAQGLAHLCEESTEAREARGRRGRERIIARYSLSSIADAYVALYENMVLGDGAAFESRRVGAPVVRAGREAVIGADVGAQSG
jgi:glycosyltransferase involved in cell wall biosynthesis